MRAVHLEQGRVSVLDIPLPERPGTFALIRLLCGGICNTDLELQRGYYGFSGTPGHEFVGEVVESDDPQLQGKRVVGEINLACGTCDWCRTRNRRHCPNRTVLGIVKHPGAFQEYFTLPDRNLHVVPEAVSDEQAVFTEPVAAACEILDQVRFPPGCPVAVLGDGKLGLLIGQVLHAAGLEVHQFGRHPEKLAIARGLGIRIGSDKGKFDYVVDATGSSAGFEQAASQTNPTGTLILKSTVHGQVAVDMARVIVNELTLIGSRCGRFEPALELLASGRVRVDGMISARMPLSEAPEAFRKAAEGGVLKVLLR